MCSLILRAKHKTVRKENEAEKVKYKNQSEKQKKALELSAVSPVRVIVY